MNPTSSDISPSATFPHSATAQESPPLYVPGSLVRVKRNISPIWKFEGCQKVADFSIIEERYLRVETIFYDEESRRFVINISGKNGAYFADDFERAVSK